MASFWYNKGKFQVLGGTIDLTNDTIKVLLVTSAYVFDADHNFVSDVSADELVISGYTGGFSGVGRQTLTGKTFTEDDTNDRAYFDANDVPWTNLAIGATIGGAILIKEITDDSDSLLIAFMDLVDTPTNGGGFTVSWNAEGILRVT